MLLCTMLSAVRTGPAVVCCYEKATRPRLSARAPKGASMIIQTLAGTIGEKKSGDGEEHALTMLHENER